MTEEHRCVGNLSMRIVGLWTASAAVHHAWAHHDLRVQDLKGATGIGGSAMEGVTQQQVADAQKAARAAADALVLTDAPLLFPPGQLALAAMRSGFNKVSLSSLLACPGRIPSGSSMRMLTGCIVTQVKVNFAGTLAHIARKAAALRKASAESNLTDLRAAISSIDAYGAEGSQAVSTEEVRRFMPAPIY